MGKVVGDGHCVALVRAACVLPATATWRRGAHVLPIADTLQSGVAIATFGSDGRYENRTDGSSHAAIFIERRGGEGIKVFDQWVSHPASYRIIRNKAGAGMAVDDASKYFIIELEEPQVA